MSIVLCVGEEGAFFPIFFFQLTISSFNFYSFSMFQTISEGTECSIFMTLHGGWFYFLLLRWHFLPLHTGSFLTSSCCVFVVHHANSIKWKEVYGSWCVSNNQKLQCNFGENNLRDWYLQCWNHQESMMLGSCDIRANAHIQTKSLKKLPKTLN